MNIQNQFAYSVAVTLATIANMIAKSANWFFRVAAVVMQLRDVMSTSSLRPR